MDFIDISKRRVTTRQFAPVPVEQEKLDKILEAGRWAPTAVNAQPQRILALNTRESLEKVREFCTFNYNPKYAELDSSCDDKAHGQCIYYYGAPLVLLVCYDRDACWKHPESGESSGPMDATIVATHMMLEAASIASAQSGSAILTSKRPAGCCICRKAGRSTICSTSAIPQKISLRIRK